MAFRYDLTDMQLLIHIADSTSMTRGAARTHLSLSAASIRIKNLEAYFGTQLLNRTNQGVVLTQAGEAFVSHARIIMAQAEHLRGDLQDYGKGLKGQVRVYANTTAMTEFMPYILQQFLTDHPNVDVHLREHLSYKIIKAVAEGSTDIGIVAGRGNNAEVEFHPYRSNRLVLVTALDHPLAKLDAVAFADTLDDNYVGLSEWSAIHPFLLRTATELGRPFRFRIEVGSFEAVCRMIEAGVGIGVIPGPVALRLQESMDIQITALTDPWAERMLHICVRSLGSLTTAARDLVDLLLADAHKPGHRPG